MCLPKSHSLPLYQLLSPLHPSPLPLKSPMPRERSKSAVPDLWEFFGPKRAKCKFSDLLQLNHMGGGGKEVRGLGEASGRKEPQPGPQIMDRGENSEEIWMNTIW